MKRLSLLLENRWKTYTPRTFSNPILSLQLFGVTLFWLGVGLRPAFVNVEILNLSVTVH